NAVAPGPGAHVENWIANARGFAKENLIVSDQSDRKDVNHGIQCVGVVKRDFAADGGHAERIAVVRNSGHYTGKQRTIAPAVFRVVERSKPQTVQSREGARAHCKDVTQNSSHAGSGALERFNER